MPSPEQLQEMESLTRQIASQTLGVAGAGISGTSYRSVDTEIISNKELRRDLDAQLQKLKGLPGSRERSLCVTKLQEAIMWLGMDLKRLSALQPTPPTATKTLRELAIAAYARYGAVTDFKNFRGDPMPEFEALPDKIKSAWEAAMSADNGRPYPSSYDPSTTKVEPTAEGLKL